MDPPDLTLAPDRTDPATLNGRFGEAPDAEAEGRDPDRLAKLLFNGLGSGVKNTFECGELGVAAGDGGALVNGEYWDEGENKEMGVEPPRLLMLFTSSFTGLRLANGLAVGAEGPAVSDLEMAKSATIGPLGVVLGDIGEAGSRWTAGPCELVAVWGDVKGVPKVVVDATD